MEQPLLNFFHFSDGAFISGGDQPQKDLAFMDTSYWKTLKRVENVANSFLGFYQIWRKFSRICERIFLHTTFFRV
jgi:hypothetical protein